MPSGLGRSSKKKPKLAAGDPYKKNESSFAADMTEAPTFRAHVEADEKVLHKPALGCIRIRWQPTSDM